MDWVSPVFDDLCVPNPKKPKLDSSFKSDVDEEILPSSKRGTIKLDTWLSLHKPKQVGDLVVHAKKIEELKLWFQTVTKTQCSKLLVITGPPGCGKTNTLQVICNSLNVQIIEWVTPLDTCSQIESSNGDTYSVYNNPALVFKDFILRASKYSNVLNSFNNLCGKIVLVKDIPNIFINKPSVFHEIMNDFSSIQCKTPIVFIISDGSVCRDLFTNELKAVCNIATINFNPIVYNSIVKALQRIVDKEKKKLSNFNIPSKNTISDIASCCGGDLRNAILKLYVVTYGGSDTNFQIKTNKKRDKKGKLLQKTVDIDQKLDIFHGLGRVLYPKKEELNEDKQMKSNTNNYKFTHSPDKIVDMYSTIPNFFTEFLQQNYLNTFTNIKDVSFGADRLSTADILLTRWQDKESVQLYGLSVAVKGLMVANKMPLRVWNPLSKSSSYEAIKELKDHALRIRQTFPEFQASPRDSFLDILPFLKTIKYQLSEEQLSYLKEYRLK